MKGQHVAPGTVLDPLIDKCIPDFPPPQFCPDGSVPQSTGPGGTQPKCPPFEAEQILTDEGTQPPTVGDRGIATEAEHLPGVGNDAADNNN